jgi:uncharacterized repeat protein (TIGR03803 family)
MSRLSAWKKASAVILLCAATAIAAHGQIFNTLVSFNGSDGGNPAFVSLVQGNDGGLYGTTYQGGTSASGTVFKISPGGILTTLYSFCSQPRCTDGDNPEVGLALATDGNFFGTTNVGGTNMDCNGFGCGTVFEIGPEGTLTTVYSFCGQPQCADGSNPIAGLVQDTNGKLYGTTLNGGAQNAGTVFRFSLDGIFTTLFTFDRNNGEGPIGTLIEGTNGNLYGTTGASEGGDGTAFKVTPGGELTTLTNFDGTNGASPRGLIQGDDGNLYGTTTNGGTNENGFCNVGNGCGTVFKMTPNGTVKTLYNFCSESGCEDGAEPLSELIQATDGNFYGTTVFGGNFTNCPSAGCGTVFRITREGTLTTLHTFDQSDGALPYGGLFQATNGMLYGTTYTGGAYGSPGTVFSLDVGLGPFVTFIRAAGKVGQTGGILGQGFTGTTSVALNGIQASFTVVSDTYIRATVPVGATTGYVTVTTPSSTLTSNVPFHVIP